MVPGLVSAPTARADEGIWIEATARATLAGAIALRRWDDEAAFSARELCLVARRGLCRQMDGGLSAAMEHQESTRGGGRSVVVVWVTGGSWKAERGGLEGLCVLGKNDCGYGCGLHCSRDGARSQRALGTRVSWGKALAIYSAQDKQSRHT